MTENHLCATVSVRGVLRGPHGQILAMKRSSDHQWELPGGRLEPDKPPVSGLERELAEETGLDVRVESILCADSWVNDQTQDRFAVYYACQTSTKAVTLSHEHVDFQWISPTEAETILSEKHMAAIRAAPTRPSDGEISSVTAQSSVSRE
jgi:8-oxo-dGTP diphosphatase